MQTDLSDGVKHLVSLGVVDPRRVCIAGQDYGGYAALAGVAFEPGTYRCAVSVAGMSDLSRFFAWTARRGSDAASRRWTRYLGVGKAEDPLLMTYSPSSHSERIDAPILLIHGEDDTVVPIEQSQIMADALRKAGKPVEFVTMQGEDHWLSQGATRLQMLQATVAFLEKHNPPN